MSRQPAGIAMRLFYKPVSLSLYAGITVLWLITMYMLFDRHYGGGFAAGGGMAESVSVEGLLGERWMAVYQAGQRTGYSVSRLTKLDNGEAPGYKSFELVFMRLRLLGVEKEIRMITDAYLDNAFRVKSFIFYVESDAAMTVSGTVEGSALNVTLDAGGVKSAQRIPLKGEPYMSLPLIPVTKKGAIRLPVIDPATLTQDVMELEVKGREPLFIMGEKVDAYRLEGSFKGAPVVMWVSEKGEPLKEESAGITLIREAKEDAVKIARPSVDFALEGAIPLEAQKKAADNPGYLKVRLKGMSLAGFELDGGAQKLSGDVLEIRRMEIKGGAGKETARLEDKEEYLTDTLFVQSKDPEIVSMAGEIVKGGRDALSKARLIYSWVYENIKKTPTVTIPSATEVLKARRGDCNEHTALYTALARAAGIPTRVAVGLAYKGGYFYYHAWPEIYVNGWIPIDPTLGQFPADAGHIRLLTGDIGRQVRLMSVMGRLRIEEVE
ncbi:MAG: transglutaminase-like domain-containing protein [Thermodesulfovibrionales bacterium]|nr:transglutaminase-like domain-containing protein [Thermodesulfovibrionales bacterium]